MNNKPNPAQAYHTAIPKTPDTIAGLPIKEDTAVQVGFDKNGRPEIQQVKQIYRPPEKHSEPIKPHWVWIWIVIIVLYIALWALLYAYFSTHQAPYAAPIK